MAQEILNGAHSTPIEPTKLLMQSNSFVLLNTNDDEVYRVLMSLET